MLPLFRRQTTAAMNGCGVAMVSETRRKILRRCRSMLLKELDTVLMLEIMSIADPDGFRQDERDVILGAASKETRAAMFLDRLETRSEKTFSAFVDALWEKQRALYNALDEETRRSVDDVMQGDKQSMKGEDVRRLLVEKCHRRRVEGGSISSGCGGLIVSGLNGGVIAGINSDIMSVDGVIDADEDRYIDCYTLTTKGHQQGERWIKHFSSSNGSEGSKCLKEPPSVAHTESNYVASLASELMFRKVELSSIRKILQNNSDIPPSFPEYVYVVDTDYKPTGTLCKNKDPSSLNLNKSLRRKPSSRSVPPPPVPPKPNKLLAGHRVGGTSILPTLKPRKSPPEEPIAPVRTTSVLASSLSASDCEKPPVPTRNTSSGRTPAPPSGRKSSGISVAGVEKLMRSYERAAAPDTSDTSGVDEEIYNFLNENITVNSAMEWAYDMERYLSREDDDDDGADGGYEPIAKIGAASAESSSGCSSKDMSAVAKTEKALVNGNSLANGSDISVDNELQKSSNVNDVNVESEGANATNSVVTQNSGKVSDADLPTYSTANMDKKSNRRSLIPLPSTDSVKKSKSFECVEVTDDGGIGNDVNVKDPLVEEGNKMVNGLDRVESNQNSLSHSSSDADSIQSNQHQVSVDFDPVKNLTMKASSDPDVHTAASTLRRVDDPLLPRSFTDVEIFGEDDSSSDNSYYEEIEMLDRQCASPSLRSSCAYLDPKSSGYSRQQSLGRIYSRRVAWEREGKRYLLRGTLLIANFNKVCLTNSNNNNISSSSTISNNISSVKGTSEIDGGGVTVEAHSLDGSRLNSQNSSQPADSTVEGASVSPSVTSLTALFNAAATKPSLYGQSKQADNNSMTSDDRLSKNSATVSMSISDDRLSSTRNSALVGTNITSSVVCPPTSASSNQPSQPQSSTTEDVDKALHDVLNGTVLTYSKDGEAFYTPQSLLSRYGDPSGEPWFYPVEMSSRQATLFLTREHLDGLFVVYRSSDRSSRAAYHLSVCRDNRGSRDVIHYPIIESLHGDLMIEGHDHSFLTLKELVEYFQKNKSSLATRLRRCLKESRLPITPGYHYPARYEISIDHLQLTGKIIGKGHFGVVCGGTYQGVSVAVKVLQRTDCGVTEEDEFIDEAKVMMGLRHDNIIKLVGVRCTVRPMFIVTEYMSKGSLKDFLRSSADQIFENLETLFNFSVQIISSLQFLESLCYVIHRDVAARNFLVSSDLCVKLADFGRARRVVDDAYQAERSEKICIKWASPEVLHNSFYSTKSDVWAAGVVLWEVFSIGERPFSTLSGEQAALYVVEGGRLDKPPGCPTDLYLLMKCCWRHLPQERPSFYELYEILKSKSSIYYTRPTSGVLALSGTAAHTGGPRGSAILQGLARASNRSGIKSASPAGIPRIKATQSPGVHSSISADMLLEPGENHRDIVEYMTQMPNSVSESSLQNYPSGGTPSSQGGDREDLTRTDKLRKSFGKLMKINNNSRVKKPPVMASLKTPTLNGD